MSKISTIKIVFGATVFLSTTTRELNLQVRVRVFCLKRATFYIGVRKVARASGGVTATAKAARSAPSYSREMRVWKTKGL